MEDRHHQLDSQPQAIGSAQIYRESEMANLDDRIAIARDYLSVSKATSLSGALVQLNEALVVVDIINATVGDHEEEHRKLRRLLTSILGAVRASAPPGVVARVPSWDDHLDPFLPHEQALRMVAREAA